MSASPRRRWAGRPDPRRNSAALERSHRPWRHRDGHEPSGQRDDRWPVPQARWAPRGCRPGADLTGGGAAPCEFGHRPRRPSRFRPRHPELLRRPHRDRNARTRLAPRPKPGHPIGAGHSGPCPGRRLAEQARRAERGRQGGTPAANRARNPAGIRSGSRIGSSLRRQSPKPVLPGLPRIRLRPPDRRRDREQAPRAPRPGPRSGASDAADPRAGVRARACRAGGSGRRSAR